MAIKTISFDSNTTPNSKPNFSKGSDIKGLNYYNSYVPLKFYTKEYGYVIINITFTGTAQYAGVSFFSSQGSTFSISENGIDSLFVPFTGGQLDGYDLKLTHGVTKTVYLIINGDDTNITNQIQVNAAIGIKSGNSPIGNSIIVETNCVVNPLYRYNTGLHSYSPYDSIFSPKLNTYLYSKDQISGWTIGTRVWASATFDMPAVQYYYGYGDYVYKVGGPIDRAYGTKEKYEVIQTLWRSIWGKKPIVNKIDTPPRIYYNSSDDTIDACVNVILTDAGIIKDVIDKFILPQPTKYKYYMGYDTSTKQLSNDNFFVKYVFGQSKFYPITGLQHLMYKLISGFIRSTNFDLNANGQLGPLLAFGIPLALGLLAVALPELNAFISSIFINGGPFGEWMYGLLTGAAGGASAFAILGIIGLIIGVIWALTKKIRKTLEEDCKKFLIEYTTTPYIELSNPLSRTSNMSTINNGYFCDGVYFYTQSGSVITGKELSSTNALISEDPIRSQFQYSLAADDPTTVVQINKLLLLCYTSGIPIEFGTGVTYFSAAIETNVPISDCSELVTTPSSINYTLPYGYIVSYISQLDADTKANAVLTSISSQVSDSYNYSQMLSDIDLGIIDSYFTHDIKIENNPNSVNCYYNNVDQAGLTIGKKLYYDELGRHEAMNGFYATEDSFYYRVFYKLNNGYVYDIYTMLNSNSTTVSGTTGTLSVNTTNLNHTSNWYFYSLSQPDIATKTNNINTQKCFDPNTLYTESYVKRGYYYSGNTFYLYDDNYTGITMTEADAGYYKPLTDWLTEPIFSYYPSMTINIDIEQICLPVSGYMNALFGFNIIGSVNGYITPLFNDVNLTVDVYVNNIIKATYTVNANSLAKTYVSYDGAISPSDNVTSIQISSINSPNPSNKITYNIGSYKPCNQKIANLSQTVITDFNSGVTLLYTITLDYAATSNVVFQIEHTNSYNSGTTISNVTIFSGYTSGAFNFTYYRQANNYETNPHFYAPTLSSEYIIGVDYLSYIVTGLQTCFLIDSQITIDSSASAWCSNLTKIAHILTADTNNIYTATKLYSGYDCVTFAAAGYYGVTGSGNWRYWNGTIFTSSGTCPSTTTTTIPVTTTTTTLYDCYSSLSSFDTYGGGNFITSYGNTALIAASNDIGDMGGEIWTSAVTLSNSLVLSGYSDWRLPTRAEWQTICNTSGSSTALGYYEYTAYWTSEEIDATQAWGWRTSDDTGDTYGGSYNVQESELKSYLLYVRPVRTDTCTPPTTTTTTTISPTALPVNIHIVGNQVTKIVLSDNGEYLYLTRTTGTYHYVEQYTLSTPYFISNRVITPYGYVFTNLGSNDQLDNVDCFSPDGRYVYTTNQLKISRYELGTPWIMSTLIPSSKQSYNTNNYLNTASEISMSFSSNGLYVSISSIKYGYGKIYVFSLPTAWSLIGIKYHIIAVLSPYVSIDGFEFSNDGNKMYIMNTFNTAKIIEYNVTGLPFVPSMEQTISNSYDYKLSMDTTALSRDFCLSSNKQYVYILSLPTLTVQTIGQFNFNVPPVTTTTTTSPTRYIGESYGGGIIAYIYQPGDPGYVVSEEHGIISDTVDLSTGLQWGGYGTLIGTTSQLLNEGGNNTNEIISILGTGNYAAKLCASSTKNGYTDWKLPSLQELRKLHTYRSLIGEFVQMSGVNYWSSSENSSTQTWLKNFLANGDETAANKQVGWTRIRAIRYF